MDKYDIAIEELKKNPAEIVNAWDFPKTHPAGCLFKKIGEGWDMELRARCGCLTQIKANIDYYAINHDKVDEEITKQIMADERIPASVSDITIDHLPVFAEWQRKIDKLYNRC